MAETREAALAAHQATLRNGATVIAYTDGSLTEQGVGAAVVSTLGRQATRIGSPATHTVYAAELQGIEMALAQIYKSIGPATQCPDQLWGHGWNIQLQWLPGHEGIYMAMNVLMPLPRTPLASRPVTTQRSQSLWLAPDEFFV